MHTRLQLPYKNSILRCQTQPRARNIQGEIIWEHSNKHKIFNLRPTCFGTGVPL